MSTQKIAFLYLFFKHLLQKLIQFTSKHKPTTDPTFHPMGWTGGGNQKQKNKKNKKKNKKKKRKKKKSK